jgi:hypothetical protein
METDIKAKLEELDTKVTLVYESVEKTRKYFLIIVWVTVLGLVLPALGLVFAIPLFMSSYTSALGL